MVDVYAIEVKSSIGKKEKLAEKLKVKYKLGYHVARCHVYSFFDKQYVYRVQKIITKIQIDGIYYFRVCSAFVYYEDDVKKFNASDYLSRLTNIVELFKGCILNIKDSKSYVYNYSFPFHRLLQCSFH